MTKFESWNFEKDQNVSVKRIHVMIALKWFN